MRSSSYGDYLVAASLVRTLLPNANLFVLDDEAIDFQLTFEGEDGMPLALEQGKDAVIVLDPEKAKILRLIAGGEQ